MSLVVTNTPSPNGATNAWTSPPTQLACPRPRAAQRPDSIRLWKVRKRRTAYATTCKSGFVEQDSLDSNLDNYRVMRPNRTEDQESTVTIDRIR